MNYTLHQLQVFLKVTQAESITKAAEELHLSQPAVSIQLKNFQDQFEIPLTEVIGRKLYITDFGKEIAAAAEKILDEVHAINYKTQAFQGQLTGRLKVTVVSTGKYVMPYFLAGFLQQHQGIELLMDVTNKTKVVESLERNEVDFSLVSVLPEKLSINDIELMPNLLHLVANRDAPYGENQYDSGIFADLPLIYREAGSGTRFVMEKFIDENSLSVRKKLELTSNEAVKQAVIAGLGSSIMPLIGIRNELANGQLRIIKVKGLPLRSTWRLIWLKDKKPSPAAAAFREYILENRQAIVREQFGWIDPFLS